MKRYIIFTLIWYVNTAFAQELDFKYVVVPDTFAKLLDESYGHSPCGASVNVHNMEDYENIVWKNGIFSYKGMGPHFPRKLFIYENNCLFAFRNWGYDVKSVLAEFMACVDSLHLDKDKIVKYLSIICQYLNEEKDDTYGAFVKPELNEESSVNGLSDNNDGTRLVLDDSARIVERLMFLPTGEVFKDEQNSTLYHSDFLFSGKELDAETGNYYFGARYLAPKLGIWLSPDPMQLKYPHVSSYAYCMGNPLKLIDPDGRDYHVYIDEKTNTIRIYAIYYAATEDAESARKAISFWNNQSGKYKYKDKVVNFDLHVNEVEVDMRYGKVESVRRKVDEDKSKAANLYVTDLNLEKEANLNGRTTQGRYIKIKPSRRETNTGAHEIGHTLGVEHQYSGIMTAAETDSSRALKINKETIKTIMKQSSDRRNTNSYAGVGIRINVVNDN